VATTLEELQAKKLQLEKEYEAIQREFSAGRNFTFGAAEENREAREVAKFRELSEVNKLIRVETGQNAAQGQTVENQIQNVNTPNQTPTTLTAEQKNNLDQAGTGELSSKVNQAQDPTAVSKQNKENTQGTVSKSEANFTSDSVNDGSSSVLGKNVTGNRSEIRIEIDGTAPRNILHNFSNYTYRITLFFLTSKDYNNLVSNPTKFVPKYSLISSGGGFSTTMSNLVAEETRTGKANYNQTLRHPDFQTNFFIDNLSMLTTVGLNAKTKSSNAINISFNIVEPYGLSLLDRLQSACETSEDATVNYITQPYLLQIDFLSSSTDEELQRSQISNNVITSKKIPIKLLEMKIKPSGSGTTYAVRAIPFHHTAFDFNVASLPVPMTVEAGTVGEFFSTDDDLVKALTGTIQANEERIERELNTWIQNNTIIFANKKPTADQIENQRRALRTAKAFNTKSLAAAYNVYNENIATQKKLSLLTPTQIAFNIPNDEIRLSKIVNPDASASTDVRMQQTSSGYNRPDDSSGYKNQQSFTIPQGRSMIDIIDMVMSRSDYIKKQIKTQGSEQNTALARGEYTGNNERSADSEPPQKINWFKILPTVALNNFDYSTNNYSKTILYSILPYTTYNVFHPSFPIVTSDSLEANIVRTYNYLYTGLNEDIIKLDIDFDSTFFTLITTKGDQVSRLSNDAVSDNNAEDVVQNKYSSLSTTVTNSTVTKGFTGSNQASTGMAKVNDPDEQVITDLKGSIYTRQRGDALNIKLQIVGDPAFIKQDDIFINAGSPDEYNSYLNSRLALNTLRPIAADGQILFDAEQIFVRVNFKNSVDINDSLGIVNQQDVLENGRRTDGTFSGIYRVLDVQNDFSRGLFTQTLHLVRMPDLLTPPKKPASNSQGAKPLTNETLDLDVPPRPGAFANPTVPETVVTPPLVQTPDQASQATQVSQSLSFEDAFRQARRDFGNRPGGVFEWRGKLYQTNYQNERYVDNPVPVYPGANE
jgi:hypothetical protein